MSAPAIAVDAESLRQVLQALVGPPHHIRELLALRNLPDSPITTLVTTYNEWCKQEEKGGQHD